MHGRNPIARYEAVGGAVTLALVTAFVMSDWFLLDRMPRFDFPGYVASLDQSQRWLSELGRRLLGS